MKPKNALKGAHYLQASNDDFRKKTKQIACLSVTDHFKSQVDTYIRESWLIPRRKIYKKNLTNLTKHTIWGSKLGLKAHTFFWTNPSILFQGKTQNLENKTF